MKNHDAVKMLASAERDLRTARELCNCAGVIDMIDAAHSKIFSVGNTLWPDVIEEARAKLKDDPMM